METKKNTRTIVCLCGSTDFMQAFQRANWEETLAGRVVLTIGCDTKSDAGLGLGPKVKAELDQLHLDKIDLAHEILVLNAGGYIGESTSREICYAKEMGKLVRWLEPIDSGLSVYRAGNQGRCACCERLAGWVRFEVDGSTLSSGSPRCERHAWRNGEKAEGGDGEA